MSAPARQIVSHEDLFCASATCARLALIVLNQPQNPGLLSALWEEAAYKVFADGAGTRMFEELPLALRDRLVPDVICGDLDSLTAPARLHYESRGAAIVRVEDQDSTDFMKSVECVRAHCGHDGAGAWSVVALGPFGGRLDHALQNLNTLYRYAGVFRRFTLLSEDCLAVLLSGAGADGTGAVAATIDLFAPCEGPTVGLLPLGAPVSSLTTRGLQWDLAGSATAFGRAGLVSTSNHVLAWDAWAAATTVAASDARSGSGTPPIARTATLLRGAVMVESSGPLIWTACVDWRAVCAQLEARRQLMEEAAAQAVSATVPTTVG